MDDVKSTINTEQLKSNSSWPLSKLIGEGSIALTAITALLFLVGWFYLAGFYDYFSLDVTALDLPPSASFIAALGPLGGLFIGIQKPIYALLIIALSLIFYKTVANTYWMRRFKGKLSSKVRFFSASPPESLEKRDSIGLLKIPQIMLVALGVFVLTVFLSAFAFNYGKRTAKDAYRAPDIRVHLVFDEGKNKLFERQLIDANDRGKLMLLVQTKDLIVVFIRNSSENSPGSFILSRSNLLAVHEVPIRSE